MYVCNFYKEEELKAPSPSIIFFITNNAKHCLHVWLVLDRTDAGSHLPAQWLCGPGCVSNLAAADSLQFLCGMS